MDSQGRCRTGISVFAVIVAASVCALHPTSAGGIVAATPSDGQPERVEVQETPAGGAEEVVQSLGAGQRKARNRARLVAESISTLHWSPAPTFFPKMRASVPVGESLIQNLTRLWM